jgi:hypothetical protein
MSTFKVGDVCIGQHFVNHPELNGMECTIDAPLAMRSVERALNDEIVTCECYAVTWADGSSSWTEPKNLRLKQPPSYPEQFTAGDWDLCPWQPTREHA